MKPSYQMVDRKDSQGFARYLAKNGQLLLPPALLPIWPISPFGGASY